MNQGTNNWLELQAYRHAAASLIATFESNQHFFAAHIPDLYQRLNSEVRYCRRLLHAGQQLSGEGQLQERLFRLFGVRVCIPCGRQLSLLAGVIRHVLVAEVRMHRHLQQRGGVQLLLDEVCQQVQLRTASGDLALLMLHDKLTELSLWFPQAACLLELRYFGRLGLRDVAAELGIDMTTLKRDMRVAKAWLMAGMR